MAMHQGPGNNDIDDDMEAILEASRLDVYEKDLEAAILASQQQTQPRPAPQPAVKPAAKPAATTKRNSEIDIVDLDEEEQTRLAIEASLETAQEQAEEKPIGRQVGTPKRQTRSTTKVEKQEEAKPAPRATRRGKKAEVKKEQPKPSKPAAAKAEPKKEAPLYEDDDELLQEALRLSQQTEIAKPTPMDRRIQEQVEKAYQNLETVLSAIGINHALITPLKALITEFRNEAPMVGSPKLEGLDVEAFLQTFFNLEEADQELVRQTFAERICQGAETAMEKMNLFLAACDDLNNFIENAKERKSAEKPVLTSPVAPKSPIQNTTVVTSPVAEKPAEKAPAPVIPVVAAPVDNEKVKRDIEQLKTRIQRIFAFEKNTNVEELKALLNNAIKFDDNASDTDKLAKLQEQFNLISKGFDSRKDKQQSLKDFLIDSKPKPPITPAMLGQLARERQERAEGKQSPVPVTPAVEKKEETKQEEQKRVQPKRNGKK